MKDKREVDVRWHPSEVIITVSHGVKVIVKEK